MDENGFTDIKRTWVERLPAPVRPYAYLSRADRPIGILLLFIPCLWGILAATDTYSVETLVFIGVFLIGSIIMRGAGCIINDLWDRDIDVQVTRTAARPIASGDISIANALVFLMVLLCVGALILFALPITAIIIGILAMAMVIAYPFMKRITYWPQAFLGLTFNIGILIGWSATEYPLGISAILLYVSAVIWTIAYDTIYAHQDIEDDLKIGIKSTAILFGAHSKRIIHGLYGAIFLFLLLFGWRSNASIIFYALLAISGIYSGYIARHWDEHSPQSSLKTFKANANIGWGIALAIALM